MTIEDFSNIKEKLIGNNVSISLESGVVVSGHWITNQVNSSTGAIRLVLKTVEGNIVVPLNIINSIKKI